MLVTVVGKKHWTSNKNGETKDYYVLNTLYQDQRVEGWAIKERFVNIDIYNAVSCGRKYFLEFSESYTGRAYISGVKPAADDSAERPI